MNKIIDLHNHLDTLQDFVLLRSKVQNHAYKIEDHLLDNHQTIISVPIHVLAWQRYNDIVYMLKDFRKKAKSYGDDLKIIETKSDLDANFKLGIIFHVESARLIKNPKSQLPQLFDLGVRGIIPLHFVDNHLGQSCDDPLRRIGLKKTDRGLTDQGYLFIEQMNQLGMWVDVSHTSDQTGNDILTHANEVMASHIAIRDITKRMRNKNLSFFKKLAEKQGIFGLQPWQHLVGNEKDSYYNHLKIVIEHGLENSVCLGTDFGAPIKTHKTIKSIYNCAKIAENLSSVSERIKFQNAYNFFKRVLPN